MCFNLFVSSDINKKDFRKRHKVNSCYFITDDEVCTNTLSNEYQEFIYLQDLERIVNRTMKSKRFSSAFIKTTEKHKVLIVETTYDFFSSDSLKITVV